jgi:hypothetical protein
VNDKANPARACTPWAGFRSGPCVEAGRNGIDTTGVAAVEWVRRRLRVSDAQANVIALLAGLGPREGRQ